LIVVYIKTMLVNRTPNSCWVLGFCHLSNKIAKIDVDHFLDHSMLLKKFQKGDQVISDKE